jgi:hypothetical protein
MWASYGHNNMTWFKRTGEAGNMDLFIQAVTHICIPVILEFKKHDKILSVDM